MGHPLEERPVSITFEQLIQLEQVCRAERAALKGYLTFGGGVSREECDQAHQRYADETARLGHELVAEVRRLWTERNAAVAPRTGRDDRDRDQVAALLDD